MANPKKALAALLPQTIQIPELGIGVAPMTLGRWAALERIGSSMITGRPAKDALELLPTLYLLTHDPREVFLGNIVDRAMEWANTLPVDALEKIQAACRLQMRCITDVVPEFAGKKAGSTGTTAGSPCSSTTQPSPTTGRSRKSCGKSHSRQSRSSGAKDSSGQME